MRTLALTALSFALVACGSSPSPAGPSNRAAAPDYTATAADVLGFIPVNAEFVVGFDLAQVRRSPQWSQIEPTLTKELEQLRTQCGYDPTPTLSRVTVGLSIPTPQHVEGVLVARDIDAEKTLACAEKMLAKDSDVSRDRGVLLIHHRSTNNASAWTAVGPSTVVIQLGQTATYDTMQRILAGGTPLRSSHFMAMFSRLEPNASAWFVINGATHAFDGFDQMNLRPRSLDGTITLTDNLAVVARATYASPDQAAQVATLANQSIGSAKQLIERVDVAAAGDTVTLNVVATAPQLQMILGSLGMMF